MSRRLGEGVLLFVCVVILVGFLGSCAYLTAHLVLKVSQSIDDQVTETQRSQSAMAVSSSSIPAG